MGPWTVRCGAATPTDATPESLGWPATPVVGQSAPEESNPSDNATDNARLAAVLPRGMSSQEACRGFTSLDLCAATLHAAQNLNIPFADLKRQVAAGQGLGDAIRSANLPLLTQVYLGTHTLRQAAAYGIEAPAQLAAK